MIIKSPNLIVNFWKGEREMKNESTAGMPVLFEEPEITVVSRNDNADKIHCHWFRYEKDSYEEPLGLFDGFDDLKVISFSYNYRFVAKISEKFKRAQVVLGGQFKATKMNEETANQLSELLSEADVLRKCVSCNERLAKRIAENEVEVRFPDGLIDHRKLYLLKADDGRTRVIFPSANISARAWTSFSQIENYAVSDDPVAYEAYLSEFETAWGLSGTVTPTARVVREVAGRPMEELSEKSLADCSDYESINDNPVIEKVKACRVATAVVLRETQDMEEKREIVLYNKELEYYREHEKEILKNIRLKVDDGKVLFVPNTIKKMEVNYKKVSLKKVDVVKRVAEYPKLVVDYEKETVSDNDGVLDLEPASEEVVSDINELLSVFSFKGFIGKIRQAQENYFKLMNAMFSSPFNAELRCVASLRDIDPSALPLYMLLNSPANCGKTFMIQYFLKMMTGKKRVGYRFDGINKSTLEAYYCEEKLLHKGVPIFIDEVTSSFKISMGGLIRCVESCEQGQREYQPMTIFASNFVSDPDEALRKRMVFLSFDIGIPSNVDKQEFKQEGRVRMNHIGTAFYRKYLSYMLPYVVSVRNKIMTGEGLDDRYYPELMQKSSEIILDILKEYGFEVPNYMKKLSWSNDYADNSRSVYHDELEKIVEMYGKERQLFTVDMKYVTVCLSNDKVGQKLVSNWVSLLPREIQAEKIPDSQCQKIRMNRKELEQHLGFRFETGIYAKLKSLLS